MIKQRDELVQAGLRATLPRVKILQILQYPQHQHISAEALYKVCLQQHEEIGLATIYRILNQFETAGIVTRHQFDSGKSLYELADCDDHDHLLCLTCGKVFEFSDHAIQQRQQAIARSHGITLTQHTLCLYGTCNDACCQYKQP